MTGREAGLRIEGVKHSNLKTGASHDSTKSGEASQLRRRMIEDVCVRKFTEKTQQDYIRHLEASRCAGQLLSRTAATFRHAPQMQSLLGANAGCLGEHRGLMDRPPSRTMTAERWRTTRTRGDLSLPA